ncbi:MAG: DUF3307 domain-containing protein [Zoogloeaceae bacterium]|jgi:hypothetical protein|nr:DUF3307 domain-containing protein [Zoogloeaceae bacterium]
MFSSSVGILFQLLVWHLIADVLLQPQALANAKRKPGVAGVAVLVLHGFIHGLGTGLILESLWAVLLETFAHTLVDFGKCRGYYGLAPDQCAHLTCLGCWWFVI